MKTVSPEFLAEQLKHVGGPVLWRIVLSHSTAGNMEITPYVIQDSLQRIEWQVEETITEAGSPDIQMSLFYNATLWAYLQDNKDIEIAVQCGFRESELLTVFTGWVDGANVELDSKGSIYLRAYSMATRCAAEKATNPYWITQVPVRWLVDYQMQQLGITNRTVKIKPIDIEGYAWGEFDASTIFDRLPRDGILPWLVLDDHTIVRAHVLNLPTGRAWSVAKTVFSDDYGDYTTTYCAIPVTSSGDLVDIIRWDADHVAAVFGDERIFYYRDGSNSRSEVDYELKKICVISLDNMTIETTNTYTRYTESGIEYIPVAASVRHFEKKDLLAIVWNGREVVYPYWIWRSRYEQRIASTNAVSKRRDITTFYFHPYTCCCAGYDSGTAWYFALLCPQQGWTNGMWGLRATETAFAIQEVDDNCNQWRGPLSPFGKYACNDGGRVVDVSTMVQVDNWWPSYPPVRIKTTFRDNTQTITGYSSGIFGLHIRTFTEPGSYSSWTTIDPDDGLIPDGYESIHGFAWFFDDGSYKAIAGLMRSEDEDGNFYQHSIIYGSRWYPYVTADVTGMTKRELFDELAKAFCCVYHFPDNDTGIFISRDYLPAETHIISTDLFSADFTIKTTPEYAVNVNGTVYGSGTKELRIDSDYIPDVEAIRLAIAQVYHAFVAEWNMEFTIVGDFLVQYEPLDVVEIYSTIDGKSYLGRIINTVQEGAMVRITARGKEA